MFNSNQAVLSFKRACADLRYSWSITLDFRASINAAEPGVHSCSWSVTITSIPYVRCDGAMHCSRHRDIPNPNEWHIIDADRRAKLASTTADDFTAMDRRSWADADLIDDLAGRVDDFVFLVDCNHKGYLQFPRADGIPTYPQSICSWQDKHDIWFDPIVLDDHSGQGLRQRRTASRTWSWPGGRPEDMIPVKRCSCTLRSFFDPAAVLMTLVPTAESSGVHLCTSGSTEGTRPTTSIDRATAS